MNTGGSPWPNSLRSSASPTTFAAILPTAAAAPGAAKVKERIAMMRQRTGDAKPDVLITIGNDHLHQFFMDNMPPS
jgi:hypothetical protein